LESCSESEEICCINKKIWRGLYFYSFYILCLLPRLLVQLRVLLDMLYKFTRTPWGNSQEFTRTLDFLIRMYGCTGSYGEACNTGSICIAEDCLVNSRTKHIDIRIHNIWQRVEEKQIVLEYVPTAKMIADVMTKPLGGQKFKGFRDQLSMKQL